MKAWQMSGAGKILQRIFRAWHRVLLSALAISCVGCEQDPVAPGVASDSAPVTWRLDNLERIGGNDVTIRGEPRVIETPAGRAIEFDGVDDAIFLDVHPLAGMTEFTVEVTFQPYPDGAAEQRFFHMQETGADSRVMFETRLPEAGGWFLDTYVRTGAHGVPLYAENHVHGFGTWYHAAIVVADGRFSHFVNGELELSEAFDYQPQGSGRTSLGVRINEVNWYRGAIRSVRFTPRALSPADFMSPAD